MLALQKGKLRPREMTESGHAPISDTEACAALATTPATQD
jgi:hypothetical protein